MCRAVFPVILSVFFMVRAVLAEPPASAPLEKPNVILITVDALRRDRMSLYGHSRKTTPYLDEFAKDAIVFENAYATSAHTSPAIVSLLTGQVPPVHAQTSSFSSYDPLIPTPIRELVARGYDTFGHFNSGPTYENLGLVAALHRRDIHEFLSLRARIPRPFFAWIHTSDTHLPYRPTERFAGEFTRPLTKKGQRDPLNTPLVRAARKFRMILRGRRFTLPYAHAEGISLNPGDQETLRAIYDECVLSADAKVGHWLDQMKANGLLDRSIVIISADHGDELLEHGWVGHASTSYDGKLTDEILKVPLIIRLPGGRFAGRYKAMTSQVDVMPTIFDLLQVDNSRLASFQQGYSLLPVLTGAVTEARDHVFAETTFKGWTTPYSEVGYRVSIVRSLSQKYVSAVRRNGAATTAFDLLSDPKELRDQWRAKPGEYRDIHQLFTKLTNGYRETAAKMVFAAAEMHLKAIEEGKEREIHLRAIENLERTWGMERFSFLQVPEKRTRWDGIQSKAAATLVSSVLTAAPAFVVKEQNS
ncbi:MAG: hypothetical protein RL326_1874 [Pseudomonadota bacterium]